MYAMQYYPQQYPSSYQDALDAMQQSVLSQQMQAQSNDNAKLQQMIQYYLHPSLDTPDRGYLVYLASNLGIILVY